MLEAYRQGFPEYRKYGNQCYFEFAREKKLVLDRWYASNPLEKSNDRLKQMMLVEEFKNHMPIEIRTYIDEQGFTNVKTSNRGSQNYLETSRTNTRTPNSAYDRRCFHCKRPGQLLAALSSVWKKE